jgi:hydrogenase maturation protein HypF
VHIEVEGPARKVDAFTTALSDEAPPQARIDSVEVEPVARHNRKGFTIKESKEQRGALTLISPDIATCPECEREIADTADRRFGYAFTNCTNCGPRFTIIEDIPYDRPKTTMSDFKMCVACQAEYDDPADRRFHAQPNACRACGPRLDFEWSKPGTVATAKPDWAEITVDLRSLRDYPLAADPIEQAARVLAAGGIVAVKGLGGFQLACDATSEAAVSRLRDRKRRYGKPLAVMMPDLATAKRYCEVAADEAALLSGPIRPICLLKMKGRGEVPIAGNVAPRNRYLGVMLPYTPLHHMLMARMALAVAGPERAAKTRRASADGRPAGAPPPGAARPPSS